MFGWNESTSSEEYVGLMDELAALDHIMSSYELLSPSSHSLYDEYEIQFLSSSYQRRSLRCYTSTIISDLSSSGQLMSVPDMIDDAWHQSPMVILPTGRSTLDSLAAFLRAYGSIKKT